MKRIGLRHFLVSLSLILSVLVPAVTAASLPKVKFAVISDLHLYDTSLGTSGEAFERYLQADRKLLKESVELANEAIKSIAASDAEFVLVPGDLTKDGELPSHKLAASMLAKLRAAGKRVYVVPGNHDILNPTAYRYLGDKVQRVNNVTPKMFRTIYKDYGYDHQLMKDDDSLSYVASLNDDMWLLALDSCLYRENPKVGEPKINGRLSKSTLEWTKKVLDKASADGKTVIVMQHHNVIEHFTGQKKKFPEYVLENNAEEAELLASKGVNLIFTGHFHSQDVVTTEVKGRDLTEVETGSLVTYPHPYRFATLNANKLRLQGKTVKSVPSLTNLPSVSRKIAFEGLEHHAKLSLGKYKVKGKSADILAPQIADRFLFHYQGDEPKNTPPINTKGVNIWGRVVNAINGRLMRGISKDLQPMDSNVVITWK